MPRSNPSGAGSWKVAESKGRRSWIASMVGALAAAAAASFGAASCSGPAPHGSQDEVDGGAFLDDAGPSSLEDDSGAPKLTAEHPGFRNPLCFGCHTKTAPYPHENEGYDPPDCVACHRYNGAPHRDHAVMENPGCPECHNAVAHVPVFSAPNDCVACHYHPKSPDGL